MNKDFELRLCRTVGGSPASTSSSATSLHNNSAFLSPIEVTSSMLTSPAKRSYASIGGGSSSSSSSPYSSVSLPVFYLVCFYFLIPHHHHFHFYF